jgi:hypothetical protein
MHGAWNVVESGILLRGTARHQESGGTARYEGQHGTRWSAEVRESIKDINN